jgi:hypothetical protein
MARVFRLLALADCGCAEVVTRLIFFPTFLPSLSNPAISPFANSGFRFPCRMNRIPKLSSQSMLRNH